MTAATNCRWRPARAGIRNVWEYDDQIFAFADGRLILRGPNGSGKSNALALLFPFLIDGTMSAAAMDPFAGGRSMRSLLLGVVKDDDARAGRFRHDQRLGYVWLELERSDGDGLRHLTVGCGARATAQRDATSWFFVTDRRVGAELDLAPDGEPLSRARLIEALGADAVTDTAEDHRAAVDRALYGFGADRHRKLVGLIRVLRRPQLAGKLDPDLLSTVLSEGLAALGASVLDDVAASLDDLEATQRELEELRATRAVVDTFLPVYHRYLVAEAAERAGATQAAVERRGRSQRDRRAAWAEVEASEAALAANTDARQATDEAGRAADAQRVAVIESPAYRDATSLREVTAAAARAEEAEAGARRRRDEAESAAQAAHEEAAAATATAAAALVTADRALTAVLDAADRADAPWTLSADDAADPERLETGARVVERARRDDVREVRQALDARQVAGRDHAHAEAAASAALAAADTATLEAQEAGEALDAARARLRHAVAGWAASAPGLDASGRAELVDAVDRVGTVGDAGPAVRYRVLVAPEREALAAAAARSEDRTRALAEQTTALEVERDRIASEADPGPEPPAWRRADRSDRPGAPLWACCDFAPALGAGDGAGLEAALAAAGLLDAWVAPGDGAPGSRPGEAPGAGGSATDKGGGQAEAGIGRADGAGSGPSDGADRVSPPERSPGAPALTAAAADPDAGSGRDPGGGEDPDGGSPARVEGVDPGDATLDSWLVAGPVENPGDGADGGARHLSDGPTLTDVLVALPPEGSGLTEDRIIEVLDGVGLGRLGVAVAADGRFTLGPLRGRAGQDAAQFIGATARAERRRRRLAEIDRELADVAERVQGERAEAERIAAAGAALDQAEADVPSTLEVEEAQATATAAGSRAEAERAVADRAAAAEAEAAAVLGQRSRTLTEVAARRRLDPSAEALDEVGELLGVLSRAASQAVGARRTAVDRAAQAAREGARAEATARLGADRNAEWAEASGEAVSLRSRADTLHEQVGAEAETAVARLAQAEATLDASRIEGRRLADVRADLSEAHGRARRSVESAEAAVADAETSVATCGARLDVLRRRDLLAVLVPEALPSPVTDDHGGVDPGDVDGIDEIGPADPLGVDVEPVDVPIGGESPIGGDVPIGGESPADGGLPAAPEDFGAWLADALGTGRPDEAELARTRKALDGAGKRLLDDIHHSYDASIARDDEIAVVEVTSEGGTFPLARLGRELATGQETLEQYLTEGDREVFERYLLNQVSHELRRLLGEAEEFVAGVNQALAGARTASGLAVELRWELGVDDSAVRDAVRLLRRDVTHLGADDLGVLRAFFERIIREQRAERPEAGYRAALEAALDYRSWHQFRPYLRTPTGGSTRLTRATFKQLSGGEQAVSLHLPLFAAAAAHYARAQPTAPRLIALDEAFAGIDEAMRGELMGLTVRFDLDVIMTGHELWGAYAEVPAVAIHDLLRRPPEEGVSVVSLRWDGADMTAAEEDVEAGG